MYHALRLQHTYWPQNLQRFGTLAHYNLQMIVFMAFQMVLNAKLVASNCAVGVMHKLALNLIATGACVQ